MASALLIVTIFILEAVSAFVDGIGYSAIATMLWNTYCSITGNKKASERLELKDSIIQLRRDLRAVSSVDEFARWAKMRRRLDAVSSKFEKISSDLALERTAFELYVNLILRATIYGLRALISIYNYRTAMFYVPENWFYPVLWFLSLPAAPMGSVSVTVWAIACNRVCKRTAVMFNHVLRPVTPRQADSSVADQNPPVTASTSALSAS
ncbi:GET complex subunit get1 [Coemansia sp. RSA 1813]|nr:GET complex subunit get1 [Coemansia sp. RSA 1646]KAJ1770124.1 GET complex subunit get1 [Coemansia sp. RSA 1843]KAJ2089837.1 GET complex subunit get1 [Coemansia sp. RSA 986]KAJ2214778.1 GET complex subunit get1 [Coemansia sp. RSA 487]KAJ2569765.1 GET complex subunit get1 [Coemansia sp. RSA 1813]